MLSTKNLSNDYRWKNKKFDSPVTINFLYEPQITIDIPKKDTPYFYNASDTINADKNYYVEELLIAKLDKRNIVLGNEGTIILKLEKLLFKEKSEDVSVIDNNGNYLDQSSKDKFTFEIYGSLVRNDSVIAQLVTIYQHSNEPRESYIIPGQIVMGGGAARADSMIENAINEFSFRVYEKLSEAKNN
ncbi:MAG: hypothetical protein V4581_00340 [Bacteroidota bacterium]